MSTQESVDLVCDFFQGVQNRQMIVIECEPVKKNLFSATDLLLRDLRQQKVSSSVCMPSRPGFFSMFDQPDA